MNIPVLFENDTCMVLNKPAGLAVQGGKGVDKSLDSILSKEFSPRPLLVHRLDKDTSGVILVAKNPQAAAFFTGLFSNTEREIHKHYLAVCRGRPSPDCGSIRLDLEVRGKLKKSETRYKTLSFDGDFSLLEIELNTGRMHQIRRHLSQIGNPILGDDKYGDFALNKSLRQKKLLLHASRLVIDAPAGFPLDVSAPTPIYWKVIGNTNLCC
jgi:23S rRNA pseudouridine955/2504/2580 synthase